MHHHQRRLGWTVDFNSSRANALSPMVRVFRERQHGIGGHGHGHGLIVIEDLVSDRVLRRVNFLRNDNEGKGEKIGFVFLLFK